MYDIQFKHKHANVSMIKINKILLLRKFIKIKNIMFVIEKKIWLKNDIWIGTFQLVKRKEVLITKHEN